MRPTRATPGPTSPATSRQVGAAVEPAAHVHPCGEAEGGIVHLYTEREAGREACVVFAAGAGP